MNSPRTNWSFGQKSLVLSLGNYTVYRNAAAHLYRPTYHHLQTETLSSEYEDFFLLITVCIMKLTSHHHTAYISRPRQRGALFIFPVLLHFLVPSAGTVDLPIGASSLCPVERATTEKAQQEALIERKVNGNAETGNIIQAWGRGGWGNCIHNFDTRYFPPGSKGLSMVLSFSSYTYLLHGAESFLRS